MIWTDKADLLRRLGLGTYDDRGRGQAIVLSGGTADPDNGALYALTSETQVDGKGNVGSLSLRLWQQSPFGTAIESHLITVKMAPVEGRKGAVALDQIWLQENKVFDRAIHDPNHPDVMKNINRVLFGAIPALNTLLREKGAVENVARILAECYMDQVKGSPMTVNGLNRKDGGFDARLSSTYLALAGKGAKAPLQLTCRDLDLFKAVHGFTINSLEPDKHHDLSRVVMSADSSSGVAYESGVTLREKGNRVTVCMYVRPDQIPQGADPKAIPDLLKLEYERAGDVYTLKNALFLDQKIEVRDIQTLHALIGAGQAMNRDFGNWKYPAYMDAIAKFNLLDRVKPLPAPPPLEKEGGEFLYVSLHGCGFEKVIEEYGDQIGIGAMFMHRGLKKDGSLSEVATLIDFPFGSGGDKSNFDGAVPNYLPFWDKVKYICITHDHYDHKGGLKFYAEKGLLRDKIIVCTPQVKYMIDRDLAKVPRQDRPRIMACQEEGALPVEDNDGNVRMWVQFCPNAVDHSALCTPYIVTGCYNDDHYKGSALIYGDSRGIKGNGIAFFKIGTRALPEQAQAWGRTVTPEKVDHDLLMALHDGTAIRNDGYSPTQEEVEQTLEVVFGWAKAAGKGIYMSPISTNNSEYVAAINTAHKDGRNIVGVGGNGEVRLSSLNLHGVDPDFNLRTIRIDPLEEMKKPESERLIPQDVLDEYFAALDDAGEVLDPEDEAATEAYQKNLARLHAKNCKAYTETLPADERAHESSTRLYMRKSLAKYGAVVFENDLNGNFMWMAIRDRMDESSLRATRTSDIGKAFREDPSSLLIMTTGTQGNSQEQFSTRQKLITATSLLDADESVRSTGYKVNLEDYIGINTQPGIVGNEVAHESMTANLVRARNTTEIVAFLNGFTVYNPKGMKDIIVPDLKCRGWKHLVDGEGNIHVYAHPIHKHGHGFRRDVINTAREIPAQSHELHHIPDLESYEIFRDVMRAESLSHSGIKPEDFKFLRLDAAQDNLEDRLKVVARINPSYILLHEERPHGQMWGGSTYWTRATLVRRDGGVREDGLTVRESENRLYRQRMSASVDWQQVSNPNTRRVDRSAILGASMVNRGDEARVPRSRPMLDMKPDPAVLELLKKMGKDLV